MPQRWNWSAPSRGLPGKKERKKGEKEKSLAAGWEDGKGARLGKREVDQPARPDRQPRSRPEEAARGGRR